MPHYKYSLNVSCVFRDRYCLSGRRCHLEDPVRSIQEAQREMRHDRQPEIQTEIKAGGAFG